MGAIEDLALALAGDQTQALIKAENPYYQLQSLPDTISALTLKAMQADPKTNLNQGLAYGIGAGLLSGLLGAKGDSYQGVLTDRYNQALINALQGHSAPIDNLPANLFRNANTAGGVFRVRRNLEQQDKLLDADLEAQKKLNEKLLDLGYVTGPNGATKVDILDPATIAADAEAAKEKARLEATNEFWGGDKGENPDNPKVKQARDIEKTTYDRITKLPAYTQFSDISNNFKTLLALVNEDSPSASIGMISSLARIWDPNGTVREGEYALNAQAQSLLDSTVGDWRSIVLGKGKLSPDAKKNIVSAASKKYNEFGKAYEQLRELNLAAMERQGGLRSNVQTLNWDPYDLATLAVGMPDQREQAIAILKQRGVAIPTPVPSAVILGGK